MDHLLWSFPTRIPESTLGAASANPSFERLILVADAYAEQARAERAEEMFRAALEVARELSISPTTLRLALRPIFSLHAVGLVAPANAAFGLLKEKARRDALDATRIDHRTTILFELADELRQLGPALPLGLRHAAARAAKAGEFKPGCYRRRDGDRRAQSGGAGALAVPHQ